MTGTKVAGAMGVYMGTSHASGFTGLFNTWTFYYTLLGPGLSHPCLENTLVESCPAEHLELLVSGICNSRFPTSLLILVLDLYLFGLFGCFLSHLLC